MDSLRDVAIFQGVDLQLNDLENYKKYAPYVMVSNEVEFISKLVNM